MFSLSHPALLDLPKYIFVRQPDDVWSHAHPDVTPGTRHRTCPPAVTLPARYELREGCNVTQCDVDSIASE